MAWTVTLDEFDTYDDAWEGFSMDLPADYNVAADCVRKHDDLDRTALHQAYPDGRRETYSFRDLDRKSDKLANALEDDGIEPGDRVVVYLPQIPETLCMNLACWKLGALSVPVNSSANSVYIRQVAESCDPKIIITNDALVETVIDVTESCPAIERIVLVGENDDHDASVSVTRYDTFVTNQPSNFDIIDSTPKTPASIMYTSGSTGPPKGALLPHEAWPGHLPGVYMNNELGLDETSVGYHHMIWGTTTGLANAVFGMWHYGGSVVGYQKDSYEPKKTFELLDEFDVTHAFIVPSWLRKMMDVEDPTAYDLSLSVITAGSERLSSEIVDWAENHLQGAVVNEIYGLTETGPLVTDCQTWYQQHHGVAGKPVPGQGVAIIDTETGEEKLRGETGAIAVRDEGLSSVLLEYWNLPEETAKLKRVDGWVLTGDLGVQNEEGYVRVFGRDDDVIISSGYQIKPDEIEAVITQHESVAEVGVITEIDEDLGEIIKAFVELRPNTEPTPILQAELKGWVKNSLDTYKSPDNIIFVSSIPTTDRGKIDRQALKQK